MTAATFVQPNRTTDSGSVYPANIDAAIRVLARLGQAFAPHEQSTPDMTVRVDAGFLFDGAMSEIAAQSTGTLVAPVSNPRIDRVVIDPTTGAVSVVTGTEAASPAAPAVPEGLLPLCQVLLATSTTAIANSIITDERTGFPLNGRLFPVRETGRAGDSEVLIVKNNATSPNSQLDLTADSILLKNASNELLLRASWNAMTDLSVSGLSGLDTGTEANNTRYYLYGISKPRMLSAVSVAGSATNDTITYVAHGLATNTPVTFGGTAVPTGVTAGVTYYVRDVTADTFKVAATPGGAAIDLTSDGTAVTMTEKPALLLSASKTSPTLPSGYTFWARVAAWYNDSSGNFQSIRQNGKTVKFSARRSLKTSVTNTAEQTESVAVYVPPDDVAKTYIIRAEAEAATPAYFDIRWVAGSNFYRILISNGGGGTVEGDTASVELPNVSQQFYWQWNSAATSRSADLDIIGYELF